MAKKLSLKSKILISLGMIAAGAGIAYGSMYQYAQNSDEVLGSDRPYSKEQLANRYAEIRKSDGELAPTLSILDPLKENKVADLNEDGTLFWFLDQPSQKMDLETFFRAYFERYQESFVLEVKYASFSFYNEYVLAVKPKQFINFSKWFMNEVAWGPDILTLESFRIVPGAEQRGNSITLGSHSTDRKESSEIKFFPDAFFGSLPIFNQAGGRGLAQDSLGYSAFSKNVNLETLEEYLSNIPLATALMNNEERSFTTSYAEDNDISRDATPNIEHFQGLLMPGRLFDKEFLAYEDQDSANEVSVTLSESNKISQKPILILPINTTEEEFNKLKEEQPVLLKNAQFSDLFKVKVADVVKQKLVDPSARKTPISMRVSFESEEHGDFDYFFKEVPGSYLEIVSLDTFRNTINGSIDNFLDFYDFNSYLNKELYVHQKENKDGTKEIQFFGSLAEAQDKLRQSGIQKNSLYKISEFSKEKLIDGSWNLDVILENITKRNLPGIKSELVLSFNSKEIKSNYNKKLEFFYFKKAIGYKGSIKPIVLSPGPENVNLTDEEGNPIRGLKSRDYQLFNEVYSGLVDIITTKYPHLLKELDGPHIEETINDQGFYEYKVVDGPYKGINDGDRIGLPLILNALIENYPGISTDFLKYVGTHEYGHHYTLEGSQGLNNQNNSVVVGALNTRGGANIQSYYSYDALKNYLDARTGLNIVRVDALGNETPNGEFINFAFNKVNSNDIYKETDDDIWGSTKSNDNVFDVIDNKLRRFLQSYETMKQAAKLRDVRLGDMFIANSFDRHSGTLNPFIEGKMSAFNKERKFEILSDEHILNIVLDGRMEQIPYVIQDNGNVDVKVIETKQNQNHKYLVTKINVHNLDGSPVIDVPLYEELSDESWDYVQKKVNAIQQGILNLIRANGNDSGWNQLSTILGGQPDISLNTLLESEPWTIWTQSVLTRKDAVEKDPFYNLYGYEYKNQRRKGYSYLALSPNNNYLNWFFIRQGYFAKNISDQMPDSISTGSDAIMKLKDATYEGNFAEVNSVVYFNENSKYSFPFVQTSKTSIDLFSDRITNRLQDFADRFDLTKAYGYNFLGFDSFWVSKNVQSENAVGFLDTENNFVLEPESGSWPIAIRFKAFNSINSKLERSLLNVETIKVDGNEESAFVFANFQEFLDYFAIDYSQFIKVGITNDNSKAKFNINLEYAKTKFNFDKFREELRKSITEDNKAEIESILASDQALANEWFRLFTKSNLFFTIKDFNPATQLVANQAILSTDYGITVLEPELRDNYYEDSSFIPEDKQRTGITIERLQDLILEVAKKHGVTTESDLNNLNSFDFYQLIGQSVKIKNNGINTPSYFSNFTYFKISTGNPSSDFLTYNLTRVEPLVNDKFTDYIYSFPETLTRDYVQTTYVPSYNNFGNLPSYLSNVNEATTGLDYIVDATKLLWINDTKLSHLEINNAQITLNAYKKFLISKDEIVKERTAAFIKKEEIKPELERLQAELEEAKKEPDTALRNTLISNIASEKLNLYSFLGTLADKVKELTNQGNAKVITIDSSLLAEDQTDSRDSSYFGKFITNSNGYFKDRWEKDMIDMKLYDDNGNPVVIPEKDRRLEFNGKKIDNQPEAFFISQLLNFGVGSRNISGIFRNKKFDALAMFGYIENEYASKAKYIKFVDVENPSVVRYLPINIENTNNIFYLRKQGDPNSKAKLEDYGYTSWISDYEYMGKYRDTLLQPKHSYYVEFVDENKQSLVEMKLGNVETIAENGKLISQSPIILTNEVDANGEKTGKVVLKINYQFNILG
ncbi:PDxFFG protein [Mycoplasmopsis glycophila]|uniref:PDxFFG protein n=1 Tax=Mycoplasmopsis glycophila TaxID=171285 RepID=A0A449AWP1_9BACT|nr:PDxFFG protein [Mycoplasmopsis glycophila]VEU71108.1 Uncharacterised protein [Mycoplasmopsis glycophila]